MHTRYKYIVLIAWMLLIFFFSSEVADASSGRSAAIIHVITESFQISFSEGLLTFLTRKAAHITLFFVFGALLYFTLRDHKWGTRRTILLSIIFTLGYAVFDETHQLFVAGRSAEVRDVLIDTAAGSIGVCMSHGLYKVLHNRSKRNVKV